jgi:hypothetical protein
VAGKAHLLAAHNFFFIKRGQRRAPVLNIKSIDPAVMADGAFFRRISLAGSPQLGMRGKDAQTQTDNYREYYNRIFIHMRK